MLTLLDNDLYKLTMMQAVFELYPDAEVEYRFTNRGVKREDGTVDKHMATEDFLRRLRSRVESLRGVHFDEAELHWLKTLGFFIFKPGFLAFLRTFSLNPDDVLITRCQGGSDSPLSINKSWKMPEQELVIRITGNWYEIILWEVPLLAMISETYYETVDKDWSYIGQGKSARNKVDTLERGGCYYADFGTRRRRSFLNQENFVETAREHTDGHFIGTSNMYLAMKYGLKPIGTAAHELTMAHMVLSGIKHCNKYAMEAWQKVYNGDLGIALTDTITSEAFFDDFDPILSRCFDGIRQDSGCPLTFTDMAVDHYKKFGIDPKTKTIIYSDGLTAEKAVEIKKYADKKGIKSGFGIGTFFTNQAFIDSPALNIVIKMYSLNGVPVVKLSDSPGKATGDPDAIRVAKWIVNGEKL